MSERIIIMSDSVTYMKIDDLDLLIIRELKKNSRRSAAEIARKVGAGERTVLRRIEKLVNNKVITFSIVVNDTLQTDHRL